MSGDGQSVAGEDTVGLLVWTGDSTATSYDTSTDNAAAKLSAITFDGSELFGGSDAAGIVNWTAATAPTAGWVALSGEVLTTKATSSDGTVIVGVGTDPSESTNEIPWTYDGVDLVWLDDLAIGTGVICDVGGIDASGSWIAGHCDGVPAVWEAGVGSTIADIVSSQSGDPTVGLSGQARAISADGSTVAGDDGSEVFLVRLP
jgi:hypothetical protein